MPLTKNILNVISFTKTHQRACICLCRLYETKIIIPNIRKHVKLICNKYYGLFNHFDRFMYYFNILIFFSLLLFCYLIFFLFYCCVFFCWNVFFVLVVPILITCLHSTLCPYIWSPGTCSMSLLCVKLLLR